MATANVNTNCLLLRTPDNRRFFTSVDHLPLLIEFSKSVGAEVSVVKTREPVETLPLKQLAKVFCDPQYEVAEVGYEVVEQKIGANPEVAPPPLVTKSKAAEIRSFVTAELMAGREVSLADLYKRYGTRISQSAIRNHLTVVRQRLAEQGFNVTRAGVGRYRVTANAD